MNQTLAKSHQAIVKSLSNGGFVLAMTLAAACWAYLFLGERLAAVQWIGAALILAAVMTMLRFQNRENFLKMERLQSENVTGVG